MTPTIAPTTAIPAGDIAAAVRVKGPVRFQDAAAYNSTLSKEQSDAASRGCHCMYIHGCKIPVGVSYNVILCDFCLYTTFFSWINPCIPFGLFWGLSRDVDGGWEANGNGKGQREASIKVVDAEHGTMAYYCTPWAPGRQVDPNDVPCCWCDK